jgi:hypothetical protein
LIHYWKVDGWELFDLQADPDEQKNLYGQPAMAKITQELKSELLRLRNEFQDEDQFASELPKDGVDGGAMRWAEGHSPQGPKVPRPQ